MNRELLHAGVANREVVLAGVALLVVATTVLGAVLGTGVLADPATSRTDTARSGHASVTEVTIAAGEVTGGSATLLVDAYFEHRGGPVENLTVALRATDTDTGLVEATREVDVGTLDSGGEHVVSSSITVPREGGYRLETIVYRDGTRVESTTSTVEGVGSLVPGYADTPVRFHRFGEDYGFGPGARSLPAIEYVVEDSSNGLARLSVSAILTNTGDEPESDLRLELKARQADSSVLADDVTVTVGTVEPGQTVTPTATLTVPDAYDYYLDAVLWKEGTIVETSRAPANLAGGNLTVDSSGDGGGIVVSDFERDGGHSPPDDDADDLGDPGGTPGFGAVGAGVALLVAFALLARRHTHD